VKLLVDSAGTVSFASQTCTMTRGKILVEYQETLVS